MGSQMSAGSTTAGGSESYVPIPGGLASSAGASLRTGTGTPAASVAGGPTPQAIRPVNPPGGAGQPQDSEGFQQQKRRGMFGVRGSVQAELIGPGTRSVPAPTQAPHSQSSGSGQRLPRPSSPAVALRPGSGSGGSIPRPAAAPGASIPKPAAAPGAPVPRPAPAPAAQFRLPQGGMPRPAAATRPAGAAGTAPSRANRFDALQEEQDEVHPRDMAEVEEDTDESLS